jgi:AcrR family transcriptional regulator
MNSDVNVVSPWPLRSAKAAATRAGIIAAAGRLFTEQGYLGTSVQLIADAAGVSRATVFNSVGGKAALLQAAYDVATVGDDAPVPLPQRPEALAIRAEPDPRRAIRMYAALVTGVSSRLAGIYEAFRSAAGVDPEVRAMWEQIQAERLGGARRFVQIIGAKGPDLADDAGDLIWVLIDTSLYHRLVIERGWSTRRFQTWLASTMEAQLLPSATAHDPPGPDAPGEEQPGA